MINRKQGHNFIPCPDCKTNIPFDPLLLLKGVEFTCPTCKSMISLSAGSRTEVKSALDQLNEIKRKDDGKKGQR